jgi:ABC-type phosphate transport system substrate-binding protein
MRVIASVICLAALLATTRGEPVWAQESVVVVVNASNPVASLSAADVSNIFLRKTVRWDGGDDIQPVDLPASSAVRERFSESVLGKAISAVQAYWQRQIFSGHGVPPVEKASEEDVLAFVRANANAIGYVAADATLGSAVKRVAVTN